MEVNPTINEIYNLIKSEKSLIPLTKTEIKENLSDFCVIKVGGHVVAAGWLQRHSKRISEIRSLVVKPEYRNRGYATRIFKTLKKKNKSDRLIAISDNASFFNPFLNEKREAVLLS